MKAVILYDAVLIRLLDLLPIRFPRCLEINRIINYLLFLFQIIFLILKKGEFCKNTVVIIRKMKCIKN